MVQDLSCNACGASLTPESRFCPACGAAVGTDAPAAVEEAPRPKRGAGILKKVAIGTAAVIGGLFVLGLLVGDTTPEEVDDTASASQSDPGVSTALAVAATATKTPTPTPTPTPSPTPTAPPAMEDWEVCQAAERLIESQLRAPSTRKWVGNCYTGSNYRIGRDASGDYPVWTVLGEVDAQNGFGAMIRSTFMVEVTDRLNGRYDARVVAFE